MPGTGPTNPFIVFPFALSSHLMSSQFLVAEAEAGVVVDEPDGLHKGIDRDRAEELEAARLEFVGDAVGKFGARRRGPVVGFRVVGIMKRLAVRKRPEPLRERAAFAAERDEALRIVDDGIDFPARADHARHGEDARDVALAVAGDLLEVEPLERHAKRRALLDDRVPAQSALQHFVHQVLEEPAVVPARRPPLLVVVRALQVVQLEIWAAYLFHGLMFCFSRKERKRRKALTDTVRSRCGGRI